MTVRLCSSFSNAARSKAVVPLSNKIVSPSSICSLAFLAIHSLASLFFSRLEEIEHLLNVPWVEWELER